MPNKNSLFETIIVSTNDTIVNNFLEGRLKFQDLPKKIFKIINLPEFRKYKKLTPKKIQDITNLAKLVRFKIKSISLMFSIPS